MNRSCLQTRWLIDIWLGSEFTERHRARHWLNRCGRTGILRTRNCAADSHDNKGEQCAKRPHLLILTHARAIASMLAAGTSYSAIQEATTK
jgi:hypothetical protein